MSELFLIVRLDGERIAFPAARVESVVEIEAVIPVPRSAPHIAGLAALRSRVVTVVDCLAALNRGEKKAFASREAVVVVADGHPYALLVESIEDVVEADSGVGPRPGMLERGWSRATLGVVEAGGDLLLVADVEALIAGPQSQSDSVAA
jgi:purine-binding chemotaxis protein CheW